jgi:dolichyl-phosphate-mannose-protein mannosyltransferase
MQMMIGMFGYLSGYNGSFIFDVGKPYEDTPYMGMRIVSLKSNYN